MVAIIDGENATSGNNHMPDLIVRKREPEIIEALLVLKKRSLAEVLAAMPNVGQDSDFARIQGKQHVGCVSRITNTNSTN